MAGQHVDNPRVVEAQQETPQTEAQKNDGVAPDGAQEAATASSNPVVNLGTFQYPVYPHDVGCLVPGVDDPRLFALRRELIDSAGPGEPLINTTMRAEHGTAKDGSPIVRTMNRGTCPDSL